MQVPGFQFNPITLAIEGAAIGFLIAVPVGPAAVLCIRRSITVGAVAGYMTGIGASLADAGLLVAAVFCGALAWWTIICTAAVSLRHRFTGTGLLWLNRASGAIILGFGVVA